LSDNGRGTFFWSKVDPSCSSKWSSLAN
jgi:hypothetical protein